MFSRHTNKFGRVIYPPSLGWVPLGSPHDVDSMTLRFVAMHTLLGAPPSPGCPPVLVDFREVRLGDSLSAILVGCLEKVCDILDGTLY